MTNAEYIREMSDEELAHFLEEVEVGDIDYTRTHCNLCNRIRLGDCRQCWLWWVKTDTKHPQGLEYWNTPENECGGL